MPVFWHSVHQLDALLRHFWTPHSPLLRSVFNFVKFKRAKRCPLQGGHFERPLKIDLLLILALSNLKFANEWGGGVLLLPVSRVPIYLLGKFAIWRTE